MAKKSGVAKSTANTPERKVTKVIEDLSCALNAVEWTSRANDLATAHKAVIEADEKKKAITKQAGNDVAIAKAKESKLADIVSSHSEIREVAVEIVYDYEKGTVTRTRTDTNEIISEREMIDAERQTELVDANDFIEGADRGKDVPEGEIVDDDPFGLEDELGEDDE